MKVKIKKLSPDAVIPKYAHAGDSGMDICSIEDVVIRPGSWSTIRTGLAVELPPGTEAQVRPRSGLAARHAISVLNNEPFAVTVGMRIAQMVICPVLRVEIEEGDTLSETARATGGFGSTGL